MGCVPLFEYVKLPGDQVPGEPFWTPAGFVCGVNSQYPQPEVSKLGTACFGTSSSKTLYQCSVSVYGLLCSALFATAAQSSQVQSRLS